jgi:hypothetical protein|tara:strand:+ start:2396 stop:2758 length:363 start_codon:yes stop_codon:yes gene_type:complete
MYIGRSWSTKNIDATHPDFIRGESRDVTQAWMDRYHGRFGDDYLIEGYEPSVDLLNDGIPDEGWSRGDISKWLAQYDIKPKGYATKSTLLNLVATVMSPDGVEETEALVEESQEEIEGDE